MYAAIRQYEMGAGSVRDLMQIIDSELAEVMSGRPGFVAYHVIASGDDEIVAVTLFREEQERGRLKRGCVGLRAQTPPTLPAQPHIRDERRGRRQPHGSGCVRRATGVLKLAIRGTQPVITSHTPTSRSATMRSER